MTTHPSPEGWAELTGRAGQRRRRRDAAAGGALAVVLLGVGGVALASGHRGGMATIVAAPQPDAAASAAVAPTPSSTAAATSISPPSSTPGRPVIGAVVDGTGASLQPPATPSTIAADDDCTKLVPPDGARVTACVTASTARGTVTAVVHVLGSATRVDVYRRDGDAAVLVLTAPGAGTITTVDPEHDGNTKILLLEPAATGLAGYDVVDVPGTVTVHRDLAPDARGAGGAVGLDAAGHLQDWSAGVLSSIRYSSGQWRLVAQQLAAVPSHPQTLQGAP